MVKIVHTKSINEIIIRIVMMSVLNAIIAENKNTKNKQIQILRFRQFRRWKVHIDNLVLYLGLTDYQMYKLNKTLPIEIMHTIYQALCKYGLIVCGGHANNSIRHSEVQQNLSVLICLNRRDI